MGLLESIRKISASLKQQRHLIKTEEAAKQVSVRPFIQALGYDLSNLNEVSPRYIGADGWEYDYAIVVENESKVLIKVTTNTRSLGTGFSKQLSRHLGPPTHRIGIITDGVHYHLYAPVDNMKSVDIELVMQIDLSDFDETTITNLKYLTKQALNPRMIVHHATNVKLKNDIRSILETNYKQPSEEFVRFFAAELQSGIIPIGFLDALAPLVRQVFREFVEGKQETPAIRDRIQPFPSPQAFKSESNIGSRTSQPKLLRDNAYAARRLYEWGTKTAKGFVKNRRGNLRIYDAAGEKHFWVEDEKILDRTCYQEMDIEISKSHRVENDNPPPESRLVNVIPTHRRFDFEYEHVGSGRYVVTRILSG